MLSISDETSRKVVLEAVKRLDAITYRIRTIVLYLPVGALFTCVFGAIIPGLEKDFPLIVKYNDSMFIASISLMSVIMAAIIIEFLRKRGNIIFNEISDELQWGLEESRSGGAEKSIERPSLDIRLSLKNFIKSSDLPFYDGPNGVLIYMLASALFWSFGAAFSSFFAR